MNITGNDILSLHSTVLMIGSSDLGVDDRNVLPNEIVKLMIELRVD